MEVYTFNCSINSDVVIACIDKFCEKNHKKKTVFSPWIILQYITQDLLGNKEQDWAEKGLELFFLPTYSPHLNIIKILWRFIKYKWLESDAYFSYSALVNAVENILKNFGTEYTNNFA